MGLRPSLLPGGLFHRDRESPPPQPQRLSRAVTTVVTFVWFLVHGVA